MEMRGRFASFKEETWGLPDYKRRVMEETVPNLVTGRQGGVCPSEKQRRQSALRSGSRGPLSGERSRGIDKTSLSFCDFSLFPGVPFSLMRTETS